MKKILVTGAFGQIGSELVPALQEKFGDNNVISVANKNYPKNFTGPIEVLDVRDVQALENVVEKHSIDTIFHLVSLLSATGEENPDLAWDVNINSLKHVLDLARDKKLKVFWPSSIAAFGPTTPRINTPQHTILEPTTMYGVTKVSGELLCQYYNKKYGVDVRSVRYPGIISWKQEPGGGTTDYAVAIFYEAIKSGRYECFVSSDTMLPMMYMDDAVKATIQLMEANDDLLSIRTSYNLAAISFTVKTLSEEINKHISVTVDYKPDSRQAIADSWPQSIDDSQARNEWGWEHSYTLEKMTKEMITKLQQKLKGDTRV